jgi:hypothetical protein
MEVVNPLSVLYTYAEYLRIRLSQSIKFVKSKPKNEPQKHAEAQRKKY